MVNFSEHLTLARLVFRGSERLSGAVLQGPAANGELEVLGLLDLEFSPRGRVKEDIDSGFFELTGGLPCQTDGGLKSFGHPIGASGLRMMYEVYKQLQGKCGERQLKDPKLGLTHNLGGFPAASSVSCCIAGL